MPAHVEEADKEADRIHREMYPDQYTAEEKDGDTPDKDSDKDGDDDSGAPDEGKTEEGNATQDDHSNAPSDSDGTPKVPDAPAAEHPAMEDFQQKYHVLKGKYDAEVPRLHSDLSALRTVVGDLQKQLSKSVAEVTKKDDTKSNKPTNEALSFVEREFPDIYNAMISLWESKDATPADQTALLQRIEAVERVAVGSVEDKFYRDLDAGVPEWRVHKDDPRFLAWLKEEDQLTGVTRLDLAQQAQNALDGKRVAKFYKAFVKQVVGEPKPEPKENTEEKKSGKDIKKFVAPPSSGGKGAGGKVTEDKNTITTSDIKHFYDDANKGRYRGRDAEFAKMEARIDKAVSNGEVVKG